ncbi:DUF3794 domain-containing protein [Inediibacterium massiliense]|uniref:DUF3794 domain-containing protein n=1 Tax=Inediibacterium massiliense TaxID=1658111 RepID=UPI0006B5E36B|nr:DUF3794 domain-containing protein [Inediibacterium massiliense]
MASVVRDLIEYVGVADCIPQNPSSFKQFNIQECFEIPTQKPDIEQIVRVSVDVDIKSTKVIKTAKGKSMEGQNLTGWKLIVEGELKQKIQYVADEPTQSVHGAHFSVWFSEFIILPKDFCEDKILNVVPYIEDIYAAQLDKRKITKNITILLDATQY